MEPGFLAQPPECEPQFGVLGCNIPRDLSVEYRYDIASLAVLVFGMRDSGDYVFCFGGLYEVQPRDPAEPVDLLKAHSALGVVGVLYGLGAKRLNNIEL